MLKKKGKRFAAVLICFSMLGCMGLAGAGAETYKGVYIDPSWSPEEIAIVKSNADFFEQIRNKNQEQEAINSQPVSTLPSVNTTVSAGERTPTEERVRAFYATEGWNYGEARDAFDIQNKEREKAGLEPLAWSDELYLYACARVREQSESYGHVRPGETKAQSQSNQYGLGFLGENAGGTASINWNVEPTSIISDWMDSEGHRSNILDTRYQSGAIACYVDESGHAAHWIAIFSREAAPTSTSRPEIQHADGTATPLPDDTILFPDRKE